MEEFKVYQKLVLLYELLMIELMLIGVSADIKVIDYTAEVTILQRYENQERANSIEAM